jgi:ADP-glucose pyrophosphorylase
LLENETREYLLVLAGDPIYKMDYAEMLDFLLTKEAAAVVSALETSLNKVSRFGMLGVDEDHRILQWDESPSPGLCVQGYLPLSRLSVSCESQALLVLTDVGLVHSISKHKKDAF